MNNKENGPAKAAIRIIQNAYYRISRFWSTHHEKISTAEELITNLQNAGILP